MHSGRRRQRTSASAPPYTLGLSGYETGCGDGAQRNCQSLTSALTPFPRRGFAANGTPRGPAFARPPRPKTTDSAALFWQRYGTKCKKGIAMRSALILRDFGQISAGKRACPCHQGLTVIRETQTGYSLSCLRVPDLGPPYRSAPGRERFPCIARA